MSLSNAYLLVRPFLPQETAEKFGAKLATLGLADEMTCDGFSIWKVRNPENLAFIIGRRSRACADQTLSLALEQQHNLIVEAVQNGKQDHLWQAYFTAEGKHISFVLNLSTGVMQIS